MALKNFKTRNGIDVDTYTLPSTVIQSTVKTNSATTVDTIPMASFTSAEYLVTVTQGSKIRTSKVVMHTDGSSVDSSEYGITETGGAIAGVVISATTSSTNAILQVTITDAATTLARVKMSRNLNVIYTPTVPDAPTIGTATASSGSASITFTAPYDNGGAEISSYQATSTPGSVTGTASSSPVTVSGLTGGTAYTFVVAAINAAGTSVASSASNSVTPPSPNSGYFAGGGSGSGVATVDKFLFADDTRSTLSTGLSVARWSLAAMANSGVAGYVGGGYGPDRPSAVVDKFALPSDSRSTLGTGLSIGNQELAAMANSGTAGYFGGGVNLGYYKTIEKFAFSNDSRTILTATLIYERKGLAAMANSGTAGYFGGGYSAANGAPFNQVDKITFSNDSRSTLGTGLSAQTRDLAAMANSGTAGYFGGGSTGSTVATVNKFTFSNDSRSTLGTGLSSVRTQLAGMANSGTAGYFGGGVPGPSDTVDKFAFSNDSRSTLATGLSTGRANLSAFANSGIL